MRVALRRSLDCLPTRWVDLEAKSLHLAINRKARQGARGHHRLIQASQAGRVIDSNCTGSRRARNSCARVGLAD